MEHEGDGDTNSKWRIRNGLQRLGKETERAGTSYTSRNRANNSIIKIDQNTEKSSGELKRLSVTLTPVKDHQLILVWKRC